MSLLHSIKKGKDGKVLMRTTASGKELIKNRGIDGELTTVSGIVIPMDWDEKGNALAAGISGLDEQEYLVEQDEKGKELLGFIRQEIEVTGVVKKVTKGRKAIKVETYGLRTSRHCCTKT